MKPSKNYSLGTMMEGGPVNVELAGTPSLKHMGATILSFEDNGLTIMVTQPPQTNTYFIPWNSIRQIQAQ